MDRWRRPRRAAPFLDRQEPRRAIAECLAPARAGRVVCVSAAFGSGSYSLAAEACHDFLSTSDGVGYLEVQAREPDGRAVGLGELAGQALRALGLPESDLPVSDVDRVDAFQRKAADERFVLVIRDAVAVEQFERLLPDSATGIAVVVTSRSRFRTLSGREVVWVDVPELPQWAARELFDVRLGPGSVGVGDAAVGEILAFCHGHPLTIEMLAGHLRGRAHATVSLLDRIRRTDTEVTRLQVLDRIVTAFDIAVAGLADRARETLLQIAWIPGPDLTAAAAARAGETPETTALESLDDLVDAGLLSVHPSTPDPGTPRYRLYPVLREQARQRGRADLGTPWCDAVVTRVVEWLLVESVPRDAALGARWRFGRAFVDFAGSGVQSPPRNEAIAWWEWEWRTIVDAVAAAHVIARHDLAAQLCVAVFKYLHMNGHVEPGLRCHDLGVASGARADDPDLSMQVRHQRGSLRSMAGDRAGAREDFMVALEAAVMTRRAEVEQSCLEWLGKLDAADGDFAAALDSFRRSEDVVDRFDSDISPEQVVRMRALLDLQRARVYGQMGDRADKSIDRANAVDYWANAVASATRALTYFDPSREPENRAKCLVALAAGQVGLDEPTIAAHQYREAARLFSIDSLRRPAATAGYAAGQLLMQEDPELARDLLSDAAHLYHLLGDRAEDDVRALLSQIDGS